MTRAESVLSILLCGVLAGCEGGLERASPPGAGGDEAPERGPHNGRMLREGGFAIELAIYETGVPPEFRAWATEDGQPVAPEQIDLTVRLTRLGGGVDEIPFRPQQDFARGIGTVYEPHSFVISVDASYGGRDYHWEYESFEGRTRISEQMAEAFGLETMVAGPAVLEETITVYGRIAPDVDRVRDVSARFDGVIETVSVSLGDVVSQGQTLATVESNESLQSYAITAPIAGVVTTRNANAGEQTRGRHLFTIIDTSSVRAELAIFPGDRPRVRAGADVTVASLAGGATAEGTISSIGVLAEPSQAVTARVVLDNSEGHWVPGAFVTADVRVGEHSVPLAVRRSALQSFRDFTVVYAKAGDQYEVRMLELGRQAGPWVEVLGGLEPGTRYVVENSYVLKADVEKAGAAHDH